jgi:hypothetical protein
MALPKDDMNNGVPLDRASTHQACYLQLPGFPSPFLFQSPPASGNASVPLVAFPLERQSGPRPLRQLMKNDAERVV